MKFFHSLSWLPVTVLASAALTTQGAEFIPDIQPIFARHCYECHGPEKQKAKLRLDDRKSALRTEDPIVVPGKPDESELLRRVTLPKGHEDIMPNRGEPLSKAETDAIRDWIAAGAVWPENAVAAKHWAYVAPVRPPTPQFPNSKWVRNDIDAFILVRLNKEKLQPSPEVDRARLLRRLYLDLIGLPPSPQETAAFVAEKNADAYERAVDKLLASPSYGERWARPWLDLARYADSLGYQKDDLWSVWPYRDWVIQALNADTPFDEFTIEQIAGDLLPNATPEQKVATGFNRCTAANLEAGSDQNETRVNQVMDRVNTVSTVWLGSTIACAQCHNHKYDPFSQKEYYQLYAFFNNTPKETDMANPKATAALRFTGPYMNLPDAKTDGAHAKLQAQLDALDEKIKISATNLLADLPAWEKKAGADTASSAQVHVLDLADFGSDGDSLHQTLPDKSILLRVDDNATTPDKEIYTVKAKTKLTDITAFKLEVLTDPSLPGTGPGRGEEKRPNFVLTDFSVTVELPGKDKPQAVKWMNAKASFEQKNFPAANAIDGKPKTGWGISPQFFKDQWAVFETKTPQGSAEGATFTFRLAHEYGVARSIGRFRLSAMTGKVSADTIPSDIAEIVKTPADQRTKAQQTRLANFYLERQPELTKQKSARSKLAAELKAIEAPRTLVMEETQPRESTMFVRGNFLEKGEPVKPGVPAVLHALPEGEPTRLMLARWLVSTNNPLVARVTVNRWWAEFFGHGLVTTPEDFGIKGEPPTHPQLLDWLAVEFMQHGWSAKHIHKLIVMSATYRQSANATPELLAADAENKFYARGPRFRLDAEMIRDNALSAAGLLSSKLGGPPVRPYQPPGIWESKVGGNKVTYEISEGEDRFRRGIYTVWKRTSPYPSFITFDAPNRNACVARRPRSNTPLQSLTLLNDPVYVEAAMALAKRVLVEKSSGDVAEKIRYAFQLCVGRAPTEKEASIVKRLFDEQLSASQRDAASATKLVKDFSKPQGVEDVVFAAWYSVASALLNLDETITKG